METPNPNIYISFFKQKKIAKGILLIKNDLPPQKEINLIIRYSPYNSVSSYLHIKLSTEPLIQTVQIHKILTIIFTISIFHK